MELDFEGLEFRNVIHKRIEKNGVICLVKDLSRDLSDALKYFA